MLTHHVSIRIDATPEKVWHVLSQVTRWPEWQPTVSHVNALDGTALCQGFRFVIRQPKLRPLTWTVSQVEHERRFVWESTSAGMKVVAEHIVVYAEPQCSQVVLRFSFEGFFGYVLGKLYGATTQRYLTEEAAALKRTVERLSGP